VVVLGKKWSCLEKSGRAWKKVVVLGKKWSFLGKKWYRRAEAQGRLAGVVMDAFWLHVGDPAALAEAEARLTR
jgi:NDP-sugar pyrophosphorylase family protein